MPFSGATDLGVAATGIGATNVLTMTLSAAIAVGDLVIVNCEAPGDVTNPNATVTSVTDSGGNTYVHVKSKRHSDGGVRYITQWACLNAATAVSIGGTVTFNLSHSTASFKRLTAFKVAAGGTVVIDTAASPSNEGTGTSWDAGATGTRAADDEIVAVFGIGRGTFSSGSPSNTPTGTYAETYNEYDANIETVNQYKIYSGDASTETPGGTWGLSYTWWMALGGAYLLSGYVDVAASLTAIGTLTATGAYVDGAASLTAVATLTATAEPVGTFGPGGAGGAMGQDKTVTIRMQTLDGVWETVGTDRLRGVWPENDSYTADEWGPSKCSFDLRRDPGAIFPDLSAWTPCEVEIAGVLVWDGRVKETPVREVERVVNVQGAGWQYHLDDDQYERVYAHTRLGDYRDARSFPQAPLSGSVAVRRNGVVEAGNGAIVLGFAAGASVTQGDGAAAILDLGPGSTAKRVVVEYENQGITAGVYNFYVQGMDSPGQIITAGELPVAVDVAVTAGPQAGTLSTARRYIGLLLYKAVTGTATETADRLVRVTACKVFADTAYESGNASALKATQIISDALDRATILLSDDRSGIDPDGTVTFNFPEFALAGQRTPREVIEAADSVHGYRKQIAVGRRPIFTPRPAVPLVEIGAWPGSEFDDPSENDGEEIYSRVIVEGTGADGSPMTVARASSQLDDVIHEPITSPAPDNPSFATDAANWTASSPSVITRTTTGGLFDSSPAGGKWDRAGNPTELGDALETTFTGTFQVGATYTLHVAFGYQAPKQGGGGVDVTFGAAGDRAITTWPDTAGGSFTVVTIAWTPASTQTSGVTLMLTARARTAWLIDTLALTVATPTLVDRRGFVRTHTLPVQCGLTLELGKQIGDVFLAAHRTTPLKGTVKVTGNQACRKIQTGAGVPAEQLLLMTGELLRLSHRTDPDTGGHCRDGRIAEVTYTPATDSAVVALDSRRTSHEALLKRLAVVVGS